jgi:hypothetical protein
MIVDDDGDEKIDVTAAKTMVLMVITLTSW